MPAAARRMRDTAAAPQNDALNRFAIGASSELTR
jgi:hypothetical protein